MHRVYYFLKKAGTYYLATDDNGQPRVRPFGTVDIFDGKLNIQTGKVKDVSRQMKANPKIEISAMVENEWIRVQAEAVLEERIEAAEHMLEAYPSLRRMYKAGDGNTEIFSLTKARATISSFAHEPIVIEF